MTTLKYLFILFLFLHGNLIAQDIKTLKLDIYALKKQIISLKKDYYKGITSTSKLHEIAVMEGSLIRKEISLTTSWYYRKMNADRNDNEIQEIVLAAFRSAFIFTDLGDTHTLRMKRILGWACMETDFKNGVICRWKKGQYIKSLRRKIKYDSVDIGVWQINDVNDFSLIPKLEYLYESGIINFKIIKIKNHNDLFDISTNCAFRCLVETERRSLGLNWKQDKSKKYLSLISDVISDLRQRGLYDEEIVSKYYYRAPIKHCFMTTIRPNN